MPPSRLSPLQERVLVALAGTHPIWTLTGGGALAGVHLGHRTTRDLDLFWHGQSTLAGIAAPVVARLRQAGLRVDALQTAQAFQQLRVVDGDDAVILDLVADPVPTIEVPESTTIGDVVLQVDTPHEILVNKLCALLGRSELRDLIDVRALLAHGLELGRALNDAPRKDSGFSPLTLAWALKQQSIAAMARTAGVDAAIASELVTFRDDLAQRVLNQARPTNDGGT
jgi:hypothetical protein